MRAYFAIFYTGNIGSGSLSALFYDGEIIGLDAAGSTITGSFSGDFDTGLKCQLIFHFEPGAQLVTGQTVEAATQVPFAIVIPQSALQGRTHPADFPTGKVNYRVELLKKL